MRALLLFIAIPSLTAADWPQFLGPQRDGKAPTGPALLTETPADGFRVVWKRKCGAGFAGPVASEGKVLLFHRVGDENVMEAMEAMSGKPAWKASWPTAYRDDFG